MVLVFEAHADWAEHVVRETVLTKKQPRRVFSMFTKYNSLFLNMFTDKITSLIQNQNEEASPMHLPNFSACLQILYLTQQVHLK